MAYKSRGVISSAFSLDLEKFLGSAINDNLGTAITIWSLIIQVIRIILLASDRVSDITGAVIIISRRAAVARISLVGVISARIRIDIGSGI